MTGFQLFCAALFALVVLVVYGLPRLAKVKALFGKKTAAPEVQPSIAVNLVNDIVAVTNLRDRLAAEGCEEGVAACTVLLRVIVEYQQPSKGVV